MDLQLSNKSVLVTAASQGIGRAIAESFLIEGAKVAICSRNKDNLILTASELRKNSGREVFWNVCNLDKEEDIIETFNLVLEQFGKIDILVNNCGGPKPGYLEDLSEKDFNDAYYQVFMSAVRFIKLCLPGMKTRKWGRILNITSLSVKQPVENLILSNSFRSALTALSKTLSMQVGKYNITVNNVGPGYTLTNRLYELAVDKAKNLGISHEEILTSMASDSSMKRLAHAAEIANYITFLASEQAGYITGTTTTIDGGAVRSTY